MLTVVVHRKKFLALPKVAGDSKGNIYQNVTHLQQSTSSVDVFRGSGQS